MAASLTLPATCPAFCTAPAVRPPNAAAVATSGKPLSAVLVNSLVPLYKPLLPSIPNAVFALPTPAMPPASCPNADAIGACSAACSS